MKYSKDSESAWSGNLTASEALYGFAAWLTTREQAVTVGANYDASIWAELVNQFCEANSLPKPREDWTTWLTHPSE